MFNIRVYLRKIAIRLNQMSQKTNSTWNILTLSLNLSKIRRFQHSDLIVRTTVRTNFLKNLSNLLRFVENTNVMSQYLFTVVSISQYN